MADLNALLGGKKENDYDADDWTTLIGVITMGKNNIDNATSIADVITAKNNAVNAVNAIKTKAEKSHETLADAKAAAKNELDNLLAGKNESDYNAEDWIALTKAIIDGKVAIDAAVTVDGVVSAKNNAVEAVNAISTSVYYIVSFDSAGGNYISSQNVLDREYASRPADPTRSGFTFRYWALNGSVYNFNTPVTGNITLTAVWTENYTPAPTPYVPENPTYISPVVTTPTTPTTSVTTTPAPAQVNHNITGTQTADAENELSWDSIPDAQSYSLYIKLNGKNVFVTDLGTATTADIVRGKDGKFYVSTGDDYAVYEYKNGKFVQKGTLPADKIDSVNRANNVTTSFTVKYTKADGTVSADNESYAVSVKVYYKPAPKATVKNGRVKLNWNKVPDAKKYRIYKYENGKLKLLKETDKVSVNIATTEGEHTYAVKAYVNGKWTAIYKSDLINVTV